jgi:dipeptidyl aminopeptidase/acylaminoacyl peptidase
MSALRWPLGADVCAGGRSVADPVLSPDGAWVAFVARDAEGGAVVVVSAGGGPEQVVARDPEPAGRGGVLAWLSNQRIAYATKDGIAVAGAGAGPGAGGGRVDIVVSGVEGGVGGLAASPGGRRLAYVADTRVVTVVDPAGGRPEVVSDTADFALDPAWSPDRATLAWQEWDVPAMPWDESRVVLAPARAGAGPDRVSLASGTGVAAQEPRFGPDGAGLAFLCDAGGWSNLWLVGGPLLAEPVEHGGPAWGPGARSFAWSPDGSAVAFCRNEAGFGRLCVVEVATGEVRELATGVWTSLSWAGERIAGLRSGARTPTAVTTVDPATGERRVLAAGPGPELAAVAEAMPEPEVVSWDGPAGTVHGRLWRPFGAADPPPLLVWAHGGPTDQRRVTFDPRLAFFLSRGWAVLHPDCRGTTGWGRGWAQALAGEWGRADVDDVAAGARAAVERGWGDSSRLVAMGGSAGGMTALLLLARDPGLWAAAVALYPVTDLEALSDTTHRFEAHYNLGLIGPLPEAADQYRQRSPIHVASRITAPVLLLHGTDDVVVPPDQSRRLAAALRQNGVAVEHHEYEGEGHGWRSPATVQDELERTAAFLEHHVPGRR